MMGLLSRCCCSPSSCRGIQLWSKAEHLGFEIPDVPELLQSGRYGSGGGSSQDDKNDFSSAVKFMRARTPINVAGYWRTDAFFPPNPETFIAGRNARDVCRGVTITGDTDDGGGITTEFRLSLYVDMQTGYVTSLDCSYTYDNVPAATHISDSYSYAIDFTDGTITETGNTAAPYPVIQTVISYIQAIQDDFDAFTYTSGTDWVEWQWTPTIGGVGSGRFSTSYGTGTRNLYFSGSDSSRDFAGAFSYKDALLDHGLANHETSSVEIFNAAGDYVGDRMQWNHVYRGLTSVELYVILYGESFPTGSYTGTLTLWPQRELLLDGDFTDALGPDASNGLSTRIITTPGLYGQYYFGAYAYNAGGGSYDTSFFAHVLAYACKVEIRGENRVFQASQPYETFDRIGYGGYVWFGHGAWANGLEISDCTSGSEPYHVLPGTHFFLPGYLVYDFGIGVIQSRTYWSGTECVTMEQTPWDGQRNPCYR